MPTYLQLWTELQRWRPALLWDGGILDQPAWVWEMLNLAGNVYESTVSRNRAMLQNLTGGAQETITPDELLG